MPNKGERNFCICHYSSSAICGVIDDESHLVLGKIIDTNFGVGQAEYEVKIIEDIMGSIPSDTIYVIGSDGFNCSNFFGVQVDTLLFNLFSYSYNNYYSDEGCGHHQLQYSSDTLSGYIYPGVYELSYEEFLADLQKCIETSMYAYVSGDIISGLTGNPIIDLELNIDGFGYDTHTNYAGRYHTGNARFDIDSGILSSISPTSNREILRGVSTLDLIKIKKHLLGIEVFSSPYELIAADVDGNKIISTNDLINIQKVILNISEEFPIGKGWEFIRSGYEFPNSNNPWFEEYPTSSREYNLEYDDYWVFDNVDFTAVKLGDVDGSI
jgi:hypothetical protein